MYNQLFVTRIRVASFFIACFISTITSAQIKPADLIKAFEGSGKTFYSVTLMTQNKSTESATRIGLPTEMEHFAIFDLDEKAVQVLGSEKKEGVAITFAIAEKKQISLKLVQVNLFPSGFQAIEMPQRTAMHAKLNGLHYQGVIDGVEGSIASLSVVDGQVYGLICSPKEGNLVLGKLATQPQYVIYKDADIASEFTFSCETSAQTTGQEFAAPSVAAREDVYAAGIWLDISNDIVVEKGSVDAAFGYVQALMAQVALIYANDGIQLFVSGAAIWSSSEPFSGLSTYKNYRSENTWSGMLAHYITLNHAGGLAWRDALCSKDKGYGVSGISSSFLEAPTYSWSTYVIAHELGHGFGSAHTHDCVWNGNNTPIDVCGSSTCPGEMPTEGGTIMSYCYLTSQGINLSLGFGEQPADLIRSHLASAPCAVPLENSVLDTNTKEVENPALHVFPNPAANEIFIELGQEVTQDGFIRLMDTRGKLITQYPILKGQKMLQSLDVSTLERGLYFLVVQLNNDQMTQKVILQ